MLLTRRDAIAAATAIPAVAAGGRPGSAQPQAAPAPGGPTPPRLPGQGRGTPAPVPAETVAR
jgi:hypothetical protein